MSPSPSTFSFFFFNDTATTEIYTLSLHDALPILFISNIYVLMVYDVKSYNRINYTRASSRSEEHTSELQSRPHLVCRLLLEKKKKSSSSHRPESYVTTTPPTVACAVGARMTYTTI